MKNFVLTPKVDATQEFIEIANDFSNPLDLVREAISNSCDAKATEIKIHFDVIKQYGEFILKITLKDNGTGITIDGLNNFFDLGNSSRRDDELSIGEKGHGTKVYFNSRKIELKTSTGDAAYFAVMDDPFRKLYDRVIPTVDVKEISATETSKGTEITIYEYNSNRRDKFTHDILRDYIGWFTKHGAIKTNNIINDKPVTLFLKGLGRSIEEIIPQGHFFPADSENVNKLFEQYLTKAPDYYVKKIVRSGSLKNRPEITFEAIFCIEGKYKKYEYNRMIRRPGYSAPEGSYTIQERYGLWVCKDYIPIQRKNEWITFKGSEYTKFHAFINCQALRLTANRGSIDNTPSEILQDLKDEIRRIYDEIVRGEEWTAMEWLEDEAAGYQTTEKEKQNFEWRVKKINRANVATYKNLILIEPERESGVFSIFLMITQEEKNLFPFNIIDYDTHEGIDVIAKGDSTTPITSAKLFYVEFKKTLSRGFNHSFENLHSVVCWDTDIKHDDIIKDVNNEERKMLISAPLNGEDYTRYFLYNPRKAHQIEVFVLKHYLEQKLGIQFKPRTAAATI